ncbi:MAG: ABC transporter ATP-binding protein [Rhodospirillaceae bacterium]|nr:ABC transporter ATP-binding protein [Alphaproteobacteria bacterium]MBR73254.1 ABC transporter ATP-binding protein [Rhodospirillaceae bacterium]|tara:strand:- start:1121 stop:1846 length:726 start_codon:yes stop_codon:yes gene_type:complete
MADTNFLLETRGLTKRFGGVIAVNDVNFNLIPGELRCLIGPNGAGKSTFFKCLTHQHKPSSGKIFFKDRDITRLHTHQIAHLGIGIKTQVPSVFDGIPVRENIWLAARRYHGRGSANKVTADVIDRVGLGNIRDSMVGRLAHGERQWVEIGMVLTSDPTLLLLDEPTAGMTHEETEKTARLIKEISESASLIVVEHDMQFIKAIANKVTVFHQGSILVEDKVEAVMANPLVRDIYLGKEKD